MAEQYLINDTTLTSIADAIRETGWPANVPGTTSQFNTNLVYSFRYNGVSYSCLQNFTPTTIYMDDAISKAGMSHAIQGIVGIQNMTDLVARKAFDGPIVTLGEGITRIRSSAFARSSDTDQYDNVTTIVMKNVEFIGDLPFSNWHNLRSMFIFGSIVPSLGSQWYGIYDFSSNFSGSIYVPASMYDAYKNNSMWQPSYHTPTLKSFYTASELGVRFVNGSIDGHSAGNFNSSYYSEATYGNQYLIDGNVLTAIASAIRGQLGVSTQYLPREMPSAIRKIGATDDDMISLVEGTLTNYSDRQSSIVTIGDYAFASCADLSSAVFPACTYIDEQAFARCSNLTYISGPQVSFIGKSAFYNCELLSQASFSKCTEISSAAFYYCSGMTIASFPECTRVRWSAFGHGHELVSVSLPKCSVIESYAFQACSVLSTLSLPACVSLGSTCFTGCSSLMSLYLMGSSVVSLQTSNMFSRTPITSSGLTGSYGSIYVPASLYSGYYSDYYWSWYRSRLVSV